MAFKVLFLAHAPDAEAEKHRWVVETPKYYKLCYTFGYTLTSSAQRSTQAPRRLPFAKRT